MKNLIIFLIALLSLTGCYTDRKATEQVNKAIVKKPQVALPLFRKAFPCVITGADTVWSSIDTIIEIPCPENGSTPVSDYFTIYDTVKVKGPTKIVKVPVTVQLPSKTITIKVKDSAGLAEKDLRITDLFTRNAVLEDKVKGRNKTILWLIITAVVLLGGNIWQLKRPLK